MSKQEHNFTATPTVKFKMYKAKKQWVMAALAFMTGAAIMVDHATVSADTTDEQSVTQVTDNAQQSDISDTNTNSVASHVNVLTSESANAADTSVSTNVQTDSDNSLVDNSQNQTAQNTQQSTNTVSNQDNSSTVSTSTTSEPTKVDSLDDNNLKSQYSDDMKASNLDYVNDVVSSETTVNDLSEVPDGNQSTTRVYYTETQKLNPPKGYISGTLPGSAGSMKAHVEFDPQVDNITMTALTDNGYLNIEDSDGEWVHLDPATFKVQVPTGTLKVNVQKMTADDIQKLITELANNTKISYQGTMYDAEVNADSNGHRFMLFKDSNHNVLKISALTGTNVPSEKNEITVAVDIADSLQVGQQLNMDTMFALGTNLYGNQVSYTTTYTYKTVTSEQIVTGNIVPKDPAGNPVGPETPYGPVAPGTTIDTPYGPVEVPANGGDITVTVATGTPGIAVYEKVAVDVPEHIELPSENEPGIAVYEKVAVDVPEHIELPSENETGIAVYEKAAVDVPEHVELPAENEPGLAVYEKVAVDVPEAHGSAVDVPEYVVVGNIVPKDPAGNPVGPETPYGPVKPGTTIDTPYGPIEVPTNGGDITVTVATGTPGIAVYEKVAVDVPEHVELPSENEPGIAVYEKTAVDVPEHVELPAESEPGIAVYEKAAVDVPEHVELPSETEPGIAVYEKVAVDVPEAHGSAVDVPEYVVAGNIVPKDPAGNPVGPEIPYGPVKPGTTIDTPYGSVIVPETGGDVVVTIKTAVDVPEHIELPSETEPGIAVYEKVAVDVPEHVALPAENEPGLVVYEKVAVDVPEAQGSAVDVPEYVVAGNIVPQDEHGNPVGPEIPYGPVKPGTTVDTPYGPVEVPTNGGDVVIQIKTPAVDAPEAQGSAVDVPEYVVAGNIVPKDPAGNPVGPEIPYGPVAPKTPIDTPYGPVVVPETGGDVVVTIKTAVDVPEHVELPAENEPGLAVYEKVAVDIPEHVALPSETEPGIAVYEKVAVDVPEHVELPAENEPGLAVYEKVAVDIPEHVALPAETEPGIAVYEKIAVDVPEHIELPSENEPGIAVYEKTAVDVPEHVELPSENEPGIAVYEKVAVDVPEHVELPAESEPGVAVYEKAAVDVPEHVELPSETEPGIAVYEKVAVDVPEAQGSAVDMPEYVVAGNIVPKDPAGNPVGPEMPYGPVKPGTTIDTPYGPVIVPETGGDVVVTIKTAVDVPEHIELPSETEPGIAVYEKVAVDVPEHVALPAENEPGIAVYEKTAVDVPEYVVAGNIVPQDENGNSVGPKIPYGPLEPNSGIVTPHGIETPGIIMNTPYGPVEVPANGGDIVVTVASEVPGIAVYEKTAVDVPEYVVAGNIVPEDENGNPVGPEIPYGPVAPGTTIDTPYGPVIVPDAGGDVAIVVKVEEKKKSPIDDIKENKDNDVMLPVANPSNDGQQINSDHSESTDKQLPKTSASQNNGHVVISGLILTSLLGLLTLLKRKNNN
ncbi:KxYKxGKxW signal peptide domain-containing protein [Leuconostoc sp.]|uniref:KxYKxGKxW signal peptide domain-containing protein n=1 Tax=Leuconostoc sp. TaxID=1930076 RepID=UPI00257D02DA|nr:KxYKxGKxW signal peptide domain-containing protein [Leuconostoc sp.]NLT86090.1 KxYKxGKxW signal peptide domain-containing protein [Leuconostoc sp.]